MVLSLEDMNMTNSEVDILVAAGQLDPATANLIKTLNNGKTSIARAAKASELKRPAGNPFSIAPGEYKGRKGFLISKLSAAGVVYPWKLVSAEDRAHLKSTL